MVGEWAWSTDNRSSYVKQAWGIDSGVCLRQIWLLDCLWKGGSCTRKGETNDRVVYSSNLQKIDVHQGFLWRPLSWNLDGASVTSPAQIGCVCPQFLRWCNGMESSGVVEQIFYPHWRRWLRSDSGRGTWLSLELTLEKHRGAKRGWRRGCRWRRIWQMNTSLPTSASHCHCDADQRWRREFRLLQSEFCRLGCPNDPEGEANELLARLSLLKGLGLTMRNYQPAQILKEGASVCQVVVERFLCCCPEHPV